MNGIVLAKSSLEAYGSKVRHVRAPTVGAVPLISDIEVALKSQPAILTITQCDTSTGVLTDVKSISLLAKRLSPNTLVIVDGVCSIGCEELRMEELL